MTLPSKYRGPSRIGKRTSYLILVLIFAGIIGGIILLAAVSPKYIPYNKFTGMPEPDYKIETLWPVLLFLFSTLGVLVFLFHKLGGRAPEWLIRRPPKQVTVDGTYPKGYSLPQLSNKNIKYSRFSRENFKRVVYHPTRNETLFGMGIAILFLSVVTFYSPMDHSWKWLGDVIIYVSSTTGLSQYFICLLIALFFFGFVIYSNLRSRDSEKLLSILSTAFMLGIFSLIFSLIISYGTGTNSIFLKMDQFTVTELIEMGDTLLSSDNYKEAISYYDRALDLEPNNPDALYQRRIALHYLDHQSFHKLER